MEEINYGIHSKLENLVNSIIEPEKEQDVIPNKLVIDNQLATSTNKLKLSSTVKDEKVEVFADVEGKNFWETYFGLQVISS